MICPVGIASDVSALQAVKVGDDAQHDLLHEGRDGAGDKVQEVILRALAKRITWWQAAEIIGISDRQMRCRAELRALSGLYATRCPFQSAATR
jgi:hypothetical protein